MTNTGTDVKPRRLRQWVLTGVLLLMAGSILGYLVYRNSDKWKKDHILVELKPIQTPKGWGYDITTDGKIFIHQNIIPAIGGDRGFRTKEDALAVGKKVYDRLMKGEVPMVTVQEVKDMGIEPADPVPASKDSVRK